MFSVIANIFNKKTKRPTLVVVGCCWSLLVVELEYLIDVCPVTRGAHIEHLSLSKKENFFSFPVAVNNPIKVGPLVFLL